MYADDTALIASGNDPKIISNTLTLNLKTCNQWFIDNQLTIHPEKTEAIFGTNRKLKKSNGLFKVFFNGKEIATKTHVKYLGCILDCDMSGKSMAQSVIRKINSRIKFLYRNAKCFDFHTRRILSNALAQCHFDYGCTSWFSGLNCNLKNKLRITQNKI